MAKVKKAMFTSKKEVLEKLLPLFPNEQKVKNKENKEKIYTIAQDFYKFDGKFFNVFLCLGKGFAALSESDLVAIRYEYNDSYRKINVNPYISKSEYKQKEYKIQIKKEPNGWVIFIGKMKLMFQKRHLLMNFAKETWDEISELHSNERRNRYEHIMQSELTSVCHTDTGIKYLLFDESLIGSSESFPSGWIRACKELGASFAVINPMNHNELYIAKTPDIAKLSFNGERLFISQKIQEIEKAATLVNDSAESQNNTCQPRIRRGGRRKRPNQ